MLAGNRVAAHTDQATRLRELVRENRRYAAMIAVASGKGGVGKSNIAVNLAVILSLRGLRVVLVDADMGLANADLMLNVQPRYTLAHVLSGERTIGDVLIPGPGGVLLVPGASGVQRVADLTEFERQHLISQVRRLRPNADIILMDCGAGIGRSVVSFAQAADSVVIVSTPQPPALTDAYALIKTLWSEGFDGQVGLVVNMAACRDEAREAHRRIAEVSRRFLNFSIAQCGYVLQDGAVETAVRRRCPFVLGFPESNASACVAAIADDLARSFAERSDGADRGGLLRRVAGLFR